MSYSRFVVPKFPEELANVARVLVQKHPDDSPEYRLGNYLLNLKADLSILEDQIREHFGDDLGEIELQ